MNEVTFVGDALTALEQAVDPASSVPEARPGPDDGQDDGADGVGAASGLPELVFVRPLPGFAQLTRFALVRMDHAADAADVDDLPDGALDGVSPDGDVPGSPDPSGLLFELRSLQAPDVRFLVAAPAAFFPDYVIDLDETACADLGLLDAEDALVLVVLSTDADTESTTANLLAPVVVNARNRSAAQIILSGTDWPVRATVA